MKWMAGVALLAAASLAHAADSKSSTCEALSAAFEAGLKDLAVIRADAGLDNSAPRETNRQLRKVFTADVMRMNLDLLQAGKCPLPKEPVSDYAYYLDALKCSTAMLRSQPGDKELPDECDRAKWTRRGFEK